MTMHLLPVYYTTTNSRKRKAKKKTATIVQEEIKTAKLLQKLGYQKNSNHRYEMPNYKTEKVAPTSDRVGNGYAKAAKQYTGDELAGIGTLHKSNMVPIRKDSNAAKEIATMRRN